MKKLKEKPIILIGIVVIIAIGISLLVYSGSPDRRLRRQLQMAEKYLEDMDYEQAVAAFAKAIEIDPKCEEAYLGLADVYIKMGDYDSAQRILEQATEFLQTNLITEKMGYVVSLWEQQYTAGIIEDTEEPESKEKPEPRTGTAGTLAGEGGGSEETLAEEITGTGSATGTESTESSVPQESSVEQESSTAGTEPTESSAEQESSTPPKSTEDSTEESTLPAPELETGGTWIDEIYNNLVMGNYMPVVELLKDREALENASAVYKENEQSWEQYDGEGREYNFKDVGYRLKTSSGKSVYLCFMYATDAESHEVRTVDATLSICSMGHDYAHYGNGSLQYGDYAVLYWEHDHLGPLHCWLAGSVWADSTGQTGILREGEFLNPGAG